MQKSTRQVMHKTDRYSTHKETRMALDESALSPKITRLDGDAKLVTPRDCWASVLLKRLDHDGRYSWWAMVGRHDMDEMSVSYTHKGEDMIRLDLPDGMPLSADSLRPHLVKYLATQGDQGDQGDRADQRGQRDQRDQRDRTGKRGQADKENRAGDPPVIDDLRENPAGDPPIIVDLHGTLSIRKV